MDDLKALGMSSEVTSSRRSGGQASVGHHLMLWTERPMPDGVRVLLGPDVEISGAWALPGSDPLRGIERAEAVIASARIRYDADVLDRAVQLRVIARTGTGVDNVSVDDCTRRGVAVCNVPDGPTVSTAEQAITLLLAVAKRLKASESSVRSGVWDIFNQHQAVELDGTTLGIIGFGKIGSRVAGVALALGMQVLVWDPYVPIADIAAAGGRPAGSLEELLRMSDAISLHAPLTPETTGLIGRQAIALMRPGCIVVNTARGGLVDEVALIEALDAGRLGGAGLDVFAHEPLPMDSSLLGRDDIVITPHVAAATVASRERLWTAAVEDALRCVRGERPRHIVNPQVLGADGTVPQRKGGRT